MEQRFLSVHLPKIINKFSPRIAKVLSNLSFPEVDDTLGSYIYGPIGCGKTIHAAGIVITECYMAFENKKPFPIWYFITVPELMLEFKKTYEKNASATESEILDRYSNADILVLDDLGVERASEWAFQLLYILINRRYENEKKTIITSNLSLEEIGNKLGDDRLASRINGMCRIIHKSGEDFRAKRK